MVSCGTRPLKTGSAVRTTKNGGLLLKSSNPDGFKKLSEDAKIAGLYDIHNIRTPQPRLRITGISEHIHENDIISFPIKQNQHIFTSSSECKLISYSSLKNNNKRFQILVQADLITYKAALNSGHWLIGLDGYSIYDGLDVLRYYNCNSFSHGKRTCNKNLSCPRCGGKHNIKECKAVEPQCSNCLSIQAKDNVTNDDIAHAAWDYRSCHYYKQVINKIRSDLFGQI